MDPVSLAIQAIGVGGGLMQAFGGGGNKPKSVDPAWLKKHFGADAVNEEMITLFNQLINSPYGQQLMTSAAEQGQQYQTDMSRRAAQAGFGPAGGAESGASIFSQAASGGAGAALARDVKGGLMQTAAPLAQQMVQSRMNAAVQSQMGMAGQPTTMQNLGGMLGDMSAAGMAAYTPKQPGLPTASLSQAASMPVNQTGQRIPMTATKSAFQPSAPVNRFERQDTGRLVTGARR